MAKLPTGLHKLNILLNQTNQPKLHIKILKWLISSGRFIVIFVEFIVIAGFILRFKLDADLADLQDKIKQQLPYIQSLKGDEIVIRQTQLQLTTASQIKHNGVNFIGVLDKIASLTPKNIKLNNISFDKPTPTAKTTIKLIGTSASNYEISSFVRGLQKDPSFAEVVLSNITFDKQAINFTVSGTVITQNRSGET